MTQQTALDRWVKRTVGPASEIDNQTPASTHLEQHQQHDADTTAASKIQPEEESQSLLSQPVAHSRLPPNVRFVHPDKKHIAGLKRLNSLLLPIPYPESFYREIVSDSIAQSLTLLAYWHSSANGETNDESPGQLVGAIRCRLLNEGCNGSRKAGPMLYLSTLVLLSPYRGHGIACSMLDNVLQHAVKTHGVTAVGAHVWEANEAALAWYAKRGFTERHFEPEYYRKLDPHGAKVMAKDVSVLDLLPPRQTQAAQP